MLTIPWLSILALSNPHGDEPLVRWKGKECTSATIAEECSDGAARAVSTWTSWASEHDYRLELNDDGRVLLLLKKRDGSAELELVERTCRFVDELLAPSLGSPASGPTTGAGSGRSSRSGVKLPATDDETAVLVQAKDSRDYRSVLDHAAEGEPYLQSWLETGEAMAGFTLVRPLAAAWIENLAGQEEWDIRNELVHRLATLLVLRRSGEQPFWLLCGIAWHVEYQIRGGIYCFPYRDGFVWASEHGSWENDLGRILERAGPAFFEELVLWKRGSYEADSAKVAWGLARFAAERHPGALASILDEMRALRAEKGIVRHGRTWELIPGWEPTLEDQDAVLARQLGANYRVAVIEEYTKRKPSKAAR